MATRGDIEDTNRKQSEPDRKAVTDGDIVDTEIGFFETVANQAQSSWERARVYTYRLLPRIDTGGKAFVAKYDHPIDESQLLADHGSGKYLLILNNGRGNILAKTTVILNAPSSPPRVRPELVIDCPENLPWVNWMREADKEKTSSAVSQASSATSGDANALERVARLAVETVSERSDRPTVDPQLIQLFEKATSDRDHLAAKLAEFANKQPISQGPDAVSLLKEIIQTSREFNTPSQTPSANPMEMMREVLQTVTELQRAAAPPVPQTPPKSGLETVRELAETMNLLRDFSQPEAEAKIPADASQWIQFAAAFAPALMPLTQALASKIMGTGTSMGTGLGVNSLAPISNAPPPPGQMQSPPTGGPTPTTGNQFDDELGMLAGQAIDAINRGVLPEDFAFGITTLRGDLFLKQVQSLGTDRIVSGYSAYPQLAPLMPKIREWVEAFVHFDPNAASEEGDDDLPTHADGREEEPAATEGRRVRRVRQTVAA